jgi:hypothetical protein
MSDVAVLLVHLVATLIRLVGAGGARAVVAREISHGLIKDYRFRAALTTAA